MLVEPPLVDCHFHVWRADLPLIDKAWHRQLRDATTPMLVDTLDRHGIIFGVIAAASLQGTYNDYVRAALREHRRLRATAIVAPDTSIDELERMKAEGFVGIRWVRAPYDEVPDLRTGEYRRLLRRVVDLDWHVHLVERPDRLVETLAVVQESGARLVIDHLGHCHADAGIESQSFKTVLRAIDRGNTWVKLSAGFRVRTPELARDYAQALVRHTGGDRLVWGSDWPFAAYEDKVQYGDTLAAFEDWVPDAALRRRIGGANALRLYFA